MMRGILLILFLGSMIAGAGGARADEAERKAVGYLAVEVPRWARENRCYSCHNNGDAARALYRAKAAGVAFGASALADTTRFLVRPETWEQNGPGGPSSDKRLARIEFALALATAVETGESDDLDALRRAADRVAADQAEDGSWPIEDGETVGSPATYGRRLATALAARVLRQAEADRHAGRIAKAVLWLHAGRISSVVDASAVLLISPTRGEPVRPEAVRVALGFLEKAQAKSGGWGPYPDMPPEPFDTALALIALAPYHGEEGVAMPAARGRRALVAMQLGDGSWPETTRPAGGESYAQRLSTTGWATIALLPTPK
jgi:hypothetical protein